MAFQKRTDKEETHGKQSLSLSASTIVAYDCSSGFNTKSNKE